ncbi:MAG: hypothetical protein M3Q55_15100 [Acidobacteriota bacterium]|nr:hypothetical protein [Acidobacteriota bacterium]
MNDTSTVFLGLIAAAVVLMAVMQIGAVIFLARYAKRVMAITEDLQREITPLIGRVSAIADEAHRATLLASKQVERVDLLVGDVTRRVHETGDAIQALVTRPMRQGSAVVTGLRAALAALLTSKPQRRFERDEEDDALFVG